MFFMPGVFLCLVAFAGCVFVRFCLLRSACRVDTVFVFSGNNGQCLLYRNDGGYNGVSETHVIAVIGRHFVDLHDRDGCFDGKMFP